MNPYNLKNIVAAYLNKAAADLTINGVDLFLDAANNASMWAQQNHNFEFTRVRASIFVDGVLGTPLAQAIIDDDTLEQVTVTGTLSPNVVGNWVENGMWGNYTLYVFPNANAPTTYLYYSTNYSKWVVSTTLTNAALTNYWSQNSASTSALGVYTAHGTNTGALTVAHAEFSSWNGIKEIKGILRQNANGTYVPIDFARADIPIERDRTVRELSDNFWPWNRCPSDADILNIRGDATVIQRRQSLFIYPTPVGVVPSTTPIPFILEAYAWLAPYTSLGLTGAADPDFLWTYGAEWLKWKIVHELNYIFKFFVPRTEGNLPSPTDMAQSAWQNLVDWDAYMVDSNTTRSR